MEPPAVRPNTERSVTAKRKKKVSVANAPPAVKEYEVNSSINERPNGSPKVIKGSLRTRDPPPAPAPSLIDYKNKPRAERKTIKKSLKWRKARAIHARLIASIEHDLLNNNNSDDDVCHIMRIIAAVDNYTYKKPDTPFQLRSYIINKYKRALSESDFNMLKEFNNYLHQKLTEPPSTN